MADERLGAASLGWLNLLQLAILLPLAEPLPLWVWGLHLLAALWRWQAWHGRWHLPRWPVKALLVALVGVGVYHSTDDIRSLEPMMLLLVSGMGLKLLEIRRHQDLLAVILLSYFVLAIALLFDRSLFQALLVVILLSAVLAAQIAWVGRGGHGWMLRYWQIGGRLLLLSLPLAAVLFLVVPRLPPLWGVPAPKASTGMSDRIQFGQVSELSQSREPAFHVRFQGSTPPRNQWYWRGVVLDQFDGLGWRRNRERLPPEGWDRPLNFSAEAPRYRYEILLEPTGARWLFSLQYPLRDELQPSDIFIGYYQQLWIPKPVVRPLRYQLTSTPTLAEPEPLDERERRYQLLLPKEGNLRTRQWAWALAQRYQGGDLLQALLSRFREEPFTYTLTPPLYTGLDAIDQFLFEGQRGFCEHYASSLAFAARAAGLPARVIGGYQGGEVNPVDQRILVRQLDAHAWVEVYLDGQGWLRIDPTQAVAPQRIEQGVDGWLLEQPQDLGAAWEATQRVSRWGWVQLTRYRLEALGYRWQQWVLDYQGLSQKALLESLLGGAVTPWRLALLLLCVGAASIGLVILISRYRQRAVSRDPALPLLQRWWRWRMGCPLPWQPTEGVNLLRQQAARLEPRSQREVERLCDLYEHYAYASEGGAQRQAWLTLRHYCRWDQLLTRRFSSVRT